MDVIMGDETSKDNENVGQEGSMTDGGIAGDGAHVGNSGLMMVDNGQGQVEAASRGEDDVDDEESIGGTGSEVATASNSSFTLPRTMSIVVDPKRSKTYRLLFVPDPTRQQSKAGAEIDLGWSFTKISEEEYLAVQDLSGNIYVRSRNNKGCRVLVDEWVCTIK
jgi:hypothetical protein